MIQKIKTLCTAAIFAAIGSFAIADTWTLDSENSQIAFGSIKKDTVGETHIFENVSGTVGADGMAMINIDLASVQTNIDIRNERMMEHVFGGLASASIAAQIDLSDVSNMVVGDMSTIDVEAVLSLIGKDIEIDTEMFVVRLSENKVMITSNEFIFLGTDEAGIDAGVSKLMELAKLPGITRTSPVTLRFIFNMDEKKVEAAPAAPATIEMAFAGDSKAGKKVFKKCKACHSIKAGKNGTGPSLHNIIGASAGAVEGFKYSNAMTDSGLTWDVATLSAFMVKPKKLIKGTKMAFAGLKKDNDIQNLLAYLAEQR